MVSPRLLESALQRGEFGAAPDQPRQATAARHFEPRSRARRHVEGEDANRLRDAGDDTVLRFADVTIRLQGVEPDDLSETDFIF